MLVENLIEQLQKFPKGTHVCIMDWRKNLGDDIGEGSSSGIYSDFEIQMQTFTDEEKEYYKECHDREFIPFIQLSFENENYTDDGKCLLDEEVETPSLNWNKLMDSLPPKNVLVWIRRNKKSGDRSNIYLGKRNGMALTDNPDYSKDCYWSGIHLDEIDQEDESNLELNFKSMFSDVTVEEWAYIVDPTITNTIKEKIKTKADQWDALYSRIEKYYYDENGDPLPEDEGDGLISIGEAAASAFGFF